MKHIALFEDFQQIQEDDVIGMAKRILELVKKDPKMKDYKLSLEDSGKGYLWLNWDNPGESELWRNSGYAEDYAPGETPKPLPCLAFLQMSGRVFCYMPLPEERYHKELYRGILSNNKQLYPLRSYQDFKNAFEGSLWGEVGLFPDVEFQEVD